MGETHLMLKLFSRPSDRDIYLITNSPPEQYSNSKIKLKEIREEIKPLSNYENAITVFDDILRTSNGKNRDQFFMGGRDNYLDKNYLSQH